MRKNFCCRIVPFMLSILTLACVLTISPKGSGHLVTYSSLNPDPEVKGVYIYKNPKKTPEQFAEKYTAFLVAPIIVYFHRDTIGHGVDTEKLKMLADYFRDRLIQALGGRYLIVDEPGPEVIRIRLAVVNVAPSKPRLSTHPSQTAFGLDKASLEAEFVDSKTGERIAAIMDTRKHEEYLKLHDQAIKEHAENIIGQWIRLIKERMDKIYGAQGIPPMLPMPPSGSDGLE